MRRFAIAAVLSSLLLAGCGQPHFTECVNPLTYTDIPDNDVIRVGDDFYMISTTMFFCPGAPIMHSRDLVHWEIVSYVYDCLNDDDIYNLRDGRNAYGKGQWAASLKYHDGVYYAFFVAWEQGKSYVFRTDDITKSNWEKTEIDRVFHDPGLLFDDDGRVYIVWGQGTLRITELKPDLSGVLEGGVDQVLLELPDNGGLRGEGTHMYHIGDWYYLLEIDWPGGGIRTETCWRSHELLGEYESMVVLNGEFDGRSDGVAQGGIVDTPKGDWYAIMFQDHGAVGRIPTLQPVTWVDGWPVMGEDTVPVKEFPVSLKPYGENRVWASDEFDSKDLDLVWQWNHKPVDGACSLSDRPGWLRLRTSSKASGIADARNTLTQRTVGPGCYSEVKVDVSGLKPGDHAGLCAFQSHFCALEVEVDEDGTRYLVGLDFEGEVNREEITQDEVWMKIIYDFNEDIAYMAYSLDGDEWFALEYSLKMRYTLDYFIGYRSALYCFCTEEAGGYADFDYFRQEII